MGRAVKALRGILEYKPQTWYPFQMDLSICEIHIRLDHLPIGAKLSIKTIFEAKEGSLIGEKKTRIIGIVKGATQYREIIFLQSGGEFTTEIYLPKDKGQPTHRCKYWIDPARERPVRRMQQKLSFLVPEEPGIGQVPENRVKPFRDEVYDQLPGTLFALQPEEQ